MKASGKSSSLEICFFTNHDEQGEPWVNLKILRKKSFKKFFHWTQNSNKVYFKTGILRRVYLVEDFKTQLFSVENNCFWKKVQRKLQKAFDKATRRKDFKWIKLFFILSVSF